jgi:hypothetical protein
MLVQYQFIETDGLFIQKYIGVCSTEHYSAFISEITKKSYFHRTQKILTDMRSVTEMKRIFENIDKVQNIRRKLLLNNPLNVHLVDQHTATAVVHLYQHEFSGEYKYSYCSTVLKAKELLDLSLPVSEIEKHLENLESEFVPESN